MRRMYSKGQLKDAIIQSFNEDFKEIDVSTLSEDEIVFELKPGQKLSIISLLELQEGKVVIIQSSIPNTIVINGFGSELDTNEIAGLVSGEKGELAFIQFDSNNQLYSVVLIICTLEGNLVVSTPREI